MCQYSSRLVLLLTILVAPLSQADARPNADWSPAVIDSVVYAGETTIIEVSMELTRSAENLSLWVVPELRPYVSISPTGIADVAAGEQILFELQISVDDAAEPQRVDGTVHLRSGKETIARPLPVSLDLQWPSIAGPGGVVVTYPGTVYAETSAESDAVLLWDKSAPPSIPESDDVGFISIGFLSNPSGEQIEQVFDGAPGDDLGDFQGTIEVGKDFFVNLVEYNSFNSILTPIIFLNSSVKETLFPFK